MKTTKEAFQKLKDALAGEDLSVRYYSGRGMFGARCLAVVADDAWDVFEALNQEGGCGYVGNDEDYQDLLIALRNSKPLSDSMGLSKVFYWPNVKMED